MANYQICDLEEFLKHDDELMSPDEFMELHKAKIQESVQIPEEHMFQHSELTTAQKCIDGEITKMLAMTPGILPPTETLPKTSKSTKKIQLPPYIPVSRNNKFPILLDEKYFRFSDDEQDDADAKSAKQTIREVMNNLDGDGRSSSNKNYRSNANSSRSNSVTEALKNRFSSIFSSEEDNCNVQSTPDSSIHEMPQNQAQRQYYNARQLYDLKRVNK